MANIYGIDNVRMRNRFLRIEPTANGGLGQDMSLRNYLYLVNQWKFPRPTSVALVVTMRLEKVGKIHLNGSFNTFGDSVRL